MLQDGLPLRTLLVPPAGPALHDSSTAPPSAATSPLCSSCAAFEPQHTPSLRGFTQFRSVCAQNVSGLTPMSGGKRFLPAMSSHCTVVPQIGIRRSKLKTTA
eukprot:4000958-Amphidinium_carterae.1